MDTTKIEYALFYNNESGECEHIYYEDLETDIYEKKYRGELYCINGCKARIRFTYRPSNNTKFFSTWNNEGKLHDINCPFYVEYSNDIGRKKLETIHANANVTDEHIKATIERKFKNIRDKSLGKERPVPKSTTRVPINTGEENISVGVDTDDANGQYLGNTYIQSIKIEEITPAYLNIRKCVYGRIHNAKTLETESGERYAYLNAKDTKYNVSIYLPEAFCNCENNDASKLEEFIKIVNKCLNKGQNLIVVCVGFISEKRNGNGLNVNILSSSHITINEASYDKIRLDRCIPDFEYEL